MIHVRRCLAGDKDVRKRSRFLIAIIHWPLICSSCIAFDTVVLTVLEPVELATIHCSVMASFYSNTCIYMYMYIQYVVREVELVGGATGRSGMMV